MQPHPPPSTRSYLDPPQLKSRTYVQLFAWFGLLIAVLHLFEGRSLGWLQLFLSVLGIFASWENVASRRSYLAVYVAGCFIWTVIDAFYMVLLIASIWSPLHDFVQGLIVSNTFRNLSGSLDELFTALGKDTGFFELFSVTTSVLFDAMAGFWAWALYVEVVQLLASSDLRMPLLRPSAPPERTGIAGFGSLSRPPASRASPRTYNPFTGRGFRLGDGDT